MNLLQSLTNMLSGGGSFGAGNVETGLLVLILSFAVGQFIAWVYMWTHTGISYSRTFVVSLVVLPTIVAMVMMVMINNIIVAFGMFAVFAVVRFRNIVKDTRDTAFILWTIIGGMAVGTMLFSVAVITSLFLAAVFFYLHMVSFGTRHRFDAVLSLDWRSAGDPMVAVMPVLHRHTVRTNLINQSGARARGMTLAYQLLMRDPDRSDQLLTELREVEGVTDASLYRHEDESEV